MLLPQKTESFWLNCKKNKVEISITKYPINTDYEAIGKTAIKYGVKLSYMGETNLITKTTNFMPFDLSGKQNIKKSFRLCFYSNNCTVLSNGRLYTCCVIPPVHIFNKYFNQNLIVEDADSIDIYAAENMEQIFDFLRKPVPFCRYCNWEKSQTQIPWHVSGKQISEWT
ncbi:MAG: hypothetical protein LBP37_04975 [Spirochaetaceae bacterium]|jgi:hypothetical protein|nr:hypothetical protein [Spirochaetaceae bacterium]